MAKKYTIADVERMRAENEKKRQELADIKKRISAKKTALSKIGSDPAMDRIKELKAKIKKTKADTRKIDRRLAKEDDLEDRRDPDTGRFTVAECSEYLLILKEEMEDSLLEMDIC